MICPNCGAMLSDPDQKYCELCGNELLNINNTTKEDVKMKPGLNRSKRRCC